MIRLNWKLALFAIFGLAIIVSSSDVSTEPTPTSSTTSPDDDPKPEADPTFSLSLQNNFNTQYSGQLTIGSNDQASSLIFDTGFPYIWVSNVTAHSTDESTLTDSPKTTEFFGRREMIRGSLQSSKVSIGQKTMNFDQTLLVSSTSEIITNLNFDGVCGLSLSADEDGSGSQVNLLDNMKTKGIINKKVFGLYMSDNPEAFGEGGSEIMFGGSNSKLYTGEFQSINVLNSNYWQVDITSMTLNKSSQAPIGVPIAAKTAIIASGVNNVLMSLEDFISFNDALKDFNITCYYDSTQNFVCPCTDGNTAGFPDIVMTLDSQEFTIPASMYLDVKETGCIVLVQGNLGNPDHTVLYSKSSIKEASRNLQQETKGVDESTSTDTDGSLKISQPQEGTFIVLGGVFLRNFYTLFDAENRTISLANAVRLPRRLITMLEVVYLVFGSFILVMFVVFVVCLIKIWTTKKVPIAEKGSLEKPIIEKRTTSGQFAQVLEGN